MKPPLLAKKKHLLQHLQELEELLNRQALEEKLFKRTNVDCPDLVTAAFYRGQQNRLQHKLDPLHPAEITYILESLPLNQRDKIWRQVTTSTQGQVLLEVSDAVRQTLISNMDTDQLASTTSHLDTDELADLAEDLPKNVMQKILYSLNDHKRQRLQSTINYPEDQVGALMDFNMITIRDDMTLKAVARYIRKLKKLPSHTDKLFVVHNKSALVGILPIQKLLTKKLESKVSEQMSTDLVSFNITGSASEAARAFERYNLISAPVLNDKNELQGRLCVDAVMDFIREETDEDILFQAGVTEEEDLFSGIWKSARNRWLWLLINVFTAFIATRVIDMFEGTIIQLVALASLMPIVAAIGGNTGNQTSMLIIRSLALGQVNSTNVKRLIKKELGIGLLNGLVWGTLIGGLVYLLYQNLALGGVMLAAMMLNLLVAAIVGVSVPLMQHKMDRDPAVGTSVIITFITDTMGFLIFLGLATIFLL